MIDEHTYEYMTEKMEEGRVYDIFKFHIKKYTPKYRVVNHEAELHFNEYTRFEPVNDPSPPIPRYAFRLLEFHDFTANLNNPTVVAGNSNIIQKNICQIIYYINHCNHHTNNIFLSIMYKTFMVVSNQ